MTLKTRCYKCRKLAVTRNHLCLNCEKQVNKEHRNVMHQESIRRKWGL